LVRQHKILAQSRSSKAAHLSHPYQKPYWLQDYKIVKSQAGNLNIESADFNDISRFKVTNPEFTTYNGKEQKQKVTVTDLHSKSSNGGGTNDGVELNGEKVQGQCARPTGAARLPSVNIRGIRAVFPANCCKGETRAGAQPLSEALPQLF